MILIICITVLLIISISGCSENESQSGRQYPSGSAQLGFEKNIDEKTPTVINVIGDIFWRKIIYGVVQEIYLQVKLSWEMLSQIEM